MPTQASIFSKLGCGGSIVGIDKNLLEHDLLKAPWFPSTIILVPHLMSLLIAFNVYMQQTPHIITCTDVIYSLKVYTVEISLLILLVTDGSKTTTQRGNTDMSLSLQQMLFHHLHPQHHHPPCQLPHLRWSRHPLYNHLNRLHHLQIVGPHTVFKLASIMLGFLSVHSQPYLLNQKAVSSAFMRSELPNRTCKSERKQQ